MESPAVEPFPNCDVHKEEVLFICLDKSCHKINRCCVFCVQKLHKNCNDDTIVEVDRLNTIVKLETVKDTEKIKECLDSLAHEGVENFEKQLTVLEQDVKLLKEKNFTKDNITPGLLKLIKNNYNLTFDSQEKKYSFEPNIVFHKQNESQKGKIKLDKKLAIWDEFFNELDDINTMFKRNLKNVQLSSVKALSLNKFIFNSFIDVEEQNGGIKISRNKKTQTKSYYAAIYEEPLLGSYNLSITIAGVDLTSPHIEIGVLDEAKYTQMKSFKMVSINSGSFSFNGSSMVGLKGSTNGYKHKLGSVLRLSINTNTGNIEITNDSGLALSSNQLKKGASYYLFVTLYSPLSSVFIRRKN